MLLARASLRSLRRAKRSLAVDAAQLEDTAAQLLKRHGVAGMQAAVIDGGEVKPVNAGLADVERNAPVATSTLFQLASLSKPVAARRALTRFDADAPVNDLLKAHGSPWRVEGPDGWGDAVTVSHLIDHSALGLHYVPGVPSTEQFPSSLELVSGRAEKWGYAAVECVKKPGSAFAYSGGGFLVLQHLLECALGPEKALAPCGGRFGYELDGAPSGESLVDFGFDVPAGKTHAVGYRDGGEVLGRLWFPPFAAGAMGTARGLGEWLCGLSKAHRDRGDGMHAVARLMLERRKDLGAGAFMGARMGRGIFIRDVASGDLQNPDRWMLHQAANDGFRGLFLVCFDGPSAANGPRGLVVLSNGDNDAMLFNCAMARAMLEGLGPVAGLDFSTVPDPSAGFDSSGLKQEEIVNLGFKSLVLDAFEEAPGFELG